MSTYYDILGCDCYASYDQLKQSYRDKVKTLHPDKTGEDSRQKFLELDKAWQTLRDENLRKEYDAVIGKIMSTPLYAEIAVAEMNYDEDKESYSYMCRCGGNYVLEKDDIKGSEEVKVSCDECTFHILIKKI